MDASRNPEYLRKTAAAVTEFKEAFKSFMDFHVETKDFPVGRGTLPAVIVRQGVEHDELQAAAARCARAAGRASVAPGLTRMYIGVAGFPEPVDPIAAWRSVAIPKPVLEPGDVLDSVEQILGRLEALTDKAEAELPPTTGVEAMHPTVWGAARRLWLDGHFRLAVQSAAETVTSQLKIRTGLASMDATNLYEKAFAIRNPLLTWPGDGSDRTVSSMQNGLAKYAPGVNMTVRNTATHAASDVMTAQQALERLAALSLLAHWIDECEDRFESGSTDHA
ncbi:TIGR02391 family protein [Streptomyces sp. NBU3104]|uniref:TIGR02391 family protein n=1 Tax=Streptomyces sp. NBU3104 TaxID=2911367 RepID=UPI001EDA672B|nr:TIGR02391 family protein [Streptomyces sp. NBU3104]UKL07421.1 TIGR02391 family protein [Streptomyces sp. NBU3104]